jgi:hypothetical protein
MAACALALGAAACGRTGLDVDDRADASPVTVPDASSIAPRPTSPGASVDAAPPLPSPPHAVSTTEGVLLAVNANGVYFTTNETPVHVKVAVRGFGVTTLPASFRGYVPAIAIDRSNLYVAVNPQEGPGAGAFAIVGLDDGSIEDQVSSTTVSGVAVDDANIYFTNLGDGQNDLGGALRRPKGRGTARNGSCTRRQQRPVRSGSRFRGTRSTGRPPVGPTIRRRRFTAGRSS